jgi:hypothetical protein
MLMTSMKNKHVTVLCILQILNQRKIWNASRICVSSLRRGHANLLCIVPILVYVLPKRVQQQNRLTPIYTRNFSIDTYSGFEIFAYFRKPFAKFKRKRNRKGKISSKGQLTNKRTHFGIRV